MSQRRGTRAFALLLAAAVLQAGCHGMRPSDTSPTTPAIVWPDPPQPARVRFLRTLTVPEDAGIKRGWWKRMRAAIKGDPRRSMVAPHGVYMSGDDRLFVVDTHYRTVHVFDARTSRYYRFPKRSLAGFIFPLGVTSGEDGRVYVSDPQAQVVHVFDEHGKRYERSIGDGLLQRPTGLAVHHGRNELLVVDTRASRVVAYDLPSLERKLVIGCDGQGAGCFHFPVGIAVSGEGLIYVTDSMNFRVQVFDPEFEFLRTFGHVGKAPGSFSRPKGVAVDSDGHVYVVDALFDNVQIFDPDGRLLLAFGNPGQAPGEFWLPSGIFIDAEDRIFVSDSYNQRVQVFQYLHPAGES